MDDLQFWVLLAVIIANGFFIEHKLQGIREQNAILIKRLILRE